jgi:hypothetical protein
MADDIVTRLREHQNPHYPLDEAADEIERLRFELLCTQFDLSLERQLTADLIEQRRMGWTGE